MNQPNSSPTDSPGSNGPSRRYSLPSDPFFPVPSSSALTPSHSLNALPPRFPSPSRSYSSSQHSFRPPRRYSALDPPFTDLPTLPPLRQVLASQPFSLDRPRYDARPFNYSQSHTYPSPYTLPNQSNGPPFSGFSLSSAQMPVGRPSYPSIETPLLFPTPSVITSGHPFLDTRPGSTSFRPIEPRPSSLPHPNSVSLPHSPVEAHSAPYTSRRSQDSPQPAFIKENPSEDQSPSSPGPTLAVSDDSNNKHQCHLCFRFYSSVGNLRRHQRSFSSFQRRKNLMFGSESMMDDSIFNVLFVKPDSPDDPRWLGT
jgi:hypothetical protein